MNNQYNAGMNNLTFGDKPMNYDQDASGGQIFDNKGGTSISTLLGKKINVNSNNINNIPIEQIAQQKMRQQAYMMQQKMAMARQNQMQQQHEYQMQQQQKQVGFNSDPHVTEYTLDESMNSADKEIHNMAKEYNKSLDEYTTSKNNNTEEIEQDEDTSLIPNILKEPILIFILYVILSQPFFRKFIFQLVPDDILTKYNLDKTMIYIIIYGLIFSMLFMIFKKLIL